jgi:hypothetical protein
MALQAIVGLARKEPSDAADYLIHAFDAVADRPSDCPIRRNRGRKLAGGRRLTHDPEKWIPVFPRDKCGAFARRSCANNELKRDGAST